MRKISLVNQKGGVGKTTTAISLSSALSKFHSKRTLLIDLDTQANATTSLGLNPSEIEFSIYDVLLRKKSLKDIIIEIDRGFYLAPSSINLSGIHVKDVNFTERYFDVEDEEYDFIIIDCPPSLGVLTVLSLCFANEIIIPVQAQYLALEGTATLLKTVQLVKWKLNRNIHILGFLCTMFDPRTKISKEIYERLLRHFKHLVFETKISRDVKLEECPAFGLSIFDYEPKSRGALLYSQFAQEVLNRGKKETGSP